MGKYVKKGGFCTKENRKAFRAPNSKIPDFSQNSYFLDESGFI